MVLQNLLKTRQNLVPQAVTPTIVEIAEQAMEEARVVHPNYLGVEFASLPPETKDQLIQYLIAYHRGKTAAVANQFTVDLTPLIGFLPSVFVREWALNRKERLELTFGTPNLRGPLAAEPVAPVVMVGEAYP